MTDYIVNLSAVDMRHTDVVGGKNASLGEMIQRLSSAGVRVPGGFATTAEAYWYFLSYNGLDEKINQSLSQLDSNDVQALVAVGNSIRSMIGEADFPPEIKSQIANAYQEMENTGGHRLEVAVRSSATAEDLPDASFAGQQESYLNVRGFEEVLQRVRDVYASLFNDRAISYRVHQQFEHHKVAISAGVQKMVRSDLAASGVMFTIDTESGFSDVVFITASYGLGEPIVQGQVNPDEFYVFKPTLAMGKDAIIRRRLGSKVEQAVFADSGIHTIEVEKSRRNQFSISDDVINSLAKMAVSIEQHYGRPMDIEWAQDGANGPIYIVQARPETVQSNEKNKIDRYILNERSTILTSGRSIGNRIGSGVARVIQSVEEMHLVRDGDVLVTEMTDPDWEPVMKRAAAIVTDRGGRTCHAAIIARELGVPAIVGSEDATRKIKAGQAVTVSCAEGDTGYVYEGNLDYSVHSSELGSLPPAPCKIMMNVGNPERALTFSKIPNDGVGLARLEFIINHMVGVHPNALLELQELPADLRQQIETLIHAYGSAEHFYQERIAEGVASIAAAFYPKPVIVRMSDFKSNEYANLLGGDRYEPHEENPMLGFRGAARYVSKSFERAFALECMALKKVRNDMGLDNVWLMVPFVRTVSEAQAVVQRLAEAGLERGKDKLKLIMMCEIPSNALLANQFLDYFDGFSIGSNDLTQLTLAVDRDSALVAESFDERNEAVKALIKLAVDACNSAGKYIGICGQGPSDHLDFAQWLIDCGVESISLNPDTVVATRLQLGKKTNLPEL